MIRLSRLADYAVVITSYMAAQPGRVFSAFELAVNRGWNVFVALIEIAAGIIIVAVPDIGVSTLAIFIGIAFILRGIGLGAAAWLLRAATHAVDTHLGGQPTDPWVLGLFAALVVLALIVAWRQEGTAPGR